MHDRHFGTQRVAATLKRRFSGSGFTLVELVVTLVIIGALAAISAPIFFNAQAFRESGFYSEMLASFRYAQKLAVASGCAVQVTVAGNSYSLTQVPSGTFNPSNMTTCNSPPYSAAVVDPAGANYTRTAPDGVSLSATTFVFCPLGNAVSGASACPSVPAAGNISVAVGGESIVVVRATGRVCDGTSGC